MDKPTIFKPGMLIEIKSLYMVLDNQKWLIPAQGRRLGISEIKMSQFKPGTIGVIIRQLPKEEYHPFEFDSEFYEILIENYLFSINGKKIKPLSKDL